MSVVDPATGLPKVTIAASNGDTAEVSPTSPFAPSRFDRSITAERRAQHPTLRPVPPQVYLHGAHVTSWKSGGEEQLFVSKSAVYGAPKAIRGGIPICWPQFSGAPLGPRGPPGRPDRLLLRLEANSPGPLAALASPHAPAPCPRPRPHRAGARLRTELRLGAAALPRVRPRPLWRRGRAPPGPGLGRAAAPPAHRGAPGAVPLPLRAGHASGGGPAAPTGLSPALGSVPQIAPVASLASGLFLLHLSRSSHDG